MIVSVFSWKNKRRQAAQEDDRVAVGVRRAAQARKDALIGQEDEVAWLEGLLFELDPVGLNFESNTDEYRAEAESITLRRLEASSRGDVQRIVHEEFVRWFERDFAGPPSRYALVADTLWLRWSENRTTDS